MPRNINPVNCYFLFKIKLFIHSFILESEGFFLATTFLQMNKQAQKSDDLPTSHSFQKADKGITQVFLLSKFMLRTIFPIITTHIHIHSFKAGLLTLREEEEYGKEMGFQESPSDAQNKGVCDPKGYLGTTHANTTTCIAQSPCSRALWLIPLTLTEKIFAVCPVCMESSFLWCSGSHTIVCWSSEPEASKLQAE